MRIFFWENKALKFITKYVQIGMFKNGDWSMFWAKVPHFWTFVTKYEFESNFLPTPTEEPKLNHWVNT